MRKVLVWMLLTKVLFGDDGWIEIASSDLPTEKIEKYLRADIDYVEFRKKLYSSKTDKPVSKKYIPYYKIARKPLDSYAPKIVKNFRKLEFQKTNVATIATFYGSPRHHYYKVNGFIIKKDKTFLVMNENVDIGWLFNGIDNLAKLMSYLYITDTFATTQRKVKERYEHSLIYRKTDNGYEIKRLNDRGLSYSREKLIQYHTYIVYLYTITKEGKLTQKKGKNMVEEKALSKDFFKGYPTIAVPLEPIHADPVWAFQSEEEMVEMELNSAKMVTP